MSVKAAVIRYLDDGNQSALRRAIAGESGEIVEAAREALKGGRHNGPCERTSDGACLIHIRTTRRRIERLADTVGQTMDWSRSEMPEVR